VTTVTNGGPLRSSRSGPTSAEPSEEKPREAAPGDTSAEEEEEGEPSGEAPEEDEDQDAGEGSQTASPEGKGLSPGAGPESPEAPAPPQFKFSTFVLIFLFFLGLYMLFDQSARNSIAGLFGDVLAPAIGFGGHYVLLTMVLAALIEMAVTALVYNITTDWVLMAQVQQDAKAIRPHQMKALRSRKKEHLDALKPHLDSLQRRQSRVTINQLKGMAVTYFLLIAIYTWVGLFIAGLCGEATSAHPVACPQTTVVFAGIQTNLLSYVGPAPMWFFLFSLYTLPISLILRRYFKHVTLSRRLRSQAPSPTVAGGGGA
jgi:uncharacterized membrane protein (DUF106 family)